MKRYLVVGAFAVAVLSGGCQSNKASSRGQLTPAVTDIAPTPPAPVYVAPQQPVQPVQPVAIAAPSDGAAAATTVSGGSYTVQRGDTLYKIAREHYGDGKQWTRIASANPGVSPQSLKVGHHANVAHFADVLRSRTTHEVLAQGDTDSGRLARAFLEDETSVLVGTRSFWGGIDAAGVACVLVVIDKIPFPVPDDPMHMARRARAQERGVDAFAAVDIPAAALVLAQGAGRLIRRRADRGVVAVFDSRLANRGYKTQLLAAMPPFRRSISLDEACDFLAVASGREPSARSTADPAFAVRVDREPDDVRVDITMNRTVLIRDVVACPVCEAKVSERCRGRDGTLAFLHHARVESVASV